jgi:hypothetical protein
MVVKETPFPVKEVKRGRHPLSFPFPALDFTYEDQAEILLIPATGPCFGLFLSHFLAGPVVVKTVGRDMRGNLLPPITLGGTIRVRMQIQGCLFIVVVS